MTKLPQYNHTSLTRSLCMLLLVTVSTAFFLVSCGLFSNTSDANNPTSTVASGINAFCQDMKNQDFTAAYALTSSAYQARYTKEDFTSQTRMKNGNTVVFLSCMVAVISTEPATYDQVTFDAECYIISTWKSGAHTYSSTHHLMFNQQNDGTCVIAPTVHGLYAD